MPAVHAFEAQVVLPIGKRGVPCWIVQDRRLTLSSGAGALPNSPSHSEHYHTARIAARNSAMSTAVMTVVPPVTVVCV